MYLQYIRPYFLRNYYNFPQSVISLRKHLIWTINFFLTLFVFKMTNESTITIYNITMKILVHQIWLPLIVQKFFRRFRRRKHVGLSKIDTSSIEYCHKLVKKTIRIIQNENYIYNNLLIGA
jgi:hypothetical protein